MGLKQSRRAITPQEEFDVGLSQRDHGGLVHATVSELLDKRMVESVLTALNDVQFYFEPTGIKRRVGESDFDEYTQSFSVPCSVEGWMAVEDISPDKAEETLIADFLTALDIKIFQNFVTAVEDKPAFIYRAIFEMVQGNNSPAHGAIRSETVGWIDFRIGQLCAAFETKLVMEVSFDDLALAKILTTYVLPRDSNVELNVPVDETTAKKHPFTPQESLRFYFSGEDKFPVPGEFVALAVEFMPIIPVTQLSLPVLVTGEWIDTTYYTTGVVESIQPDEVGDEGNTYTVKVKGRSLSGIKSTDFATYNIGDRVAIIKTLGSQANADFNNLVFDGSDLVKIAPITFYQE